MDADPAREDELHAREADAVARQERLLERLLRVADVEHDLRARPRDGRRVDLLDVEGHGAGVDVPASPSAHESVTSPAPARAVVAPTVPTMAGMPSSRATIAACEVRPPRSVTMPPAIFMTGSQSGSVISVTRMSPRLELVGLARVVKHAYAAAHDALADRRAPRRAGSRAPSSRRGAASGAVRRLCTVSGRAWTTKSSPLIAVLGPLDVHRRVRAAPLRVVLLDRRRPARERRGRRRQRGRSGRAPSPARARCAPAGGPARRRRGGSPWFRAASTRAARSPPSASPCGRGTGRARRVPERRSRRGPSSRSRG